MRAAALFVLTLAACANPQATDYQGEPIERAARDLGFPSRIVELPDGRRTYEWQIEQVASVGPIKPQIGGISVSSRGGVGVGVGLGRDRVSTGFCSYILTARPEGETYIVEGVNDTGRSCL